jgi:hypothetical protein
MSIRCICAPISIPTIKMFHEEEKKEKKKASIDII